MSITYRKLAALALLVYAASQLLVLIELTHDAEREGQIFVGAFLALALALSVMAALVDRWWATAIVLVAATLSVLTSVTYIDHIRYFNRAWEFAPISLLGFGGITAVIFAAGDLIQRRRRVPVDAPAILAPAYGLSVAALATLIAVSFAVTYTSIDAVSARDRGGATVLRMTEWKFSPNELTTSRDEPLKLVIENDDLATHTFVLKAGGVSVDEAFGAGDERVVDLSFSEAGTFAFECDLPDHADMKGTITVE
jgi:plastocyanin